MTLSEQPQFLQLKISGKLPTPKGVALEVISLTQKDNVSNQAIIRLISTDAALSMRVIKAANALLGNMSRPIATIADAVTVLGARALRQLVLGIALVLDYRQGPCKQFDYAHFWVHSLLTGIAARHLALQSRLASPDELFVVGLLSNIGNLALATVFEKEYGLLLDQAGGSAVPDQLAIERRQFGFDATELSEAILADISFSKIFQKLVREYREPERSGVVEGSREWQLLYLLHSASLMADICLATPQTRGALVEKLRVQATRLAIESDRLVLVGEASSKDWLVWSGLLGVGAVELPSFAQLLQESEQAQQAVHAHYSAEFANTYPLRVLVVDDDRVMSALLQSKLRNAGHTVFSAGDGLEALEMVAQHRPQLIITDWLMPKLDGVTLCAKLRQDEQWRDIYVIVMTAQEDMDKLVEAFEAGADDYLVKPINAKIFFARLRAGMRVVKLQEELAEDREQLVKFSAELSQVNDRLQQLALTDVLTGLPNRRAAMERLEQEWSLTQRADRALTCLMVDVDHFKKINDTLGHPVGDIALKYVAQTLRLSVRTQDVVCRFGGEEFLVICPDANIEEGYQCAERLRKNIESMVGSDAQLSTKITVSVGVAVNTPEMKSLDELLTRADKQLYTAKQSGRNRTVC